MLFPSAVACRPSLEDPPRQLVGRLPGNVLPTRKRRQRIAPSPKRLNAPGVSARTLAATLGAAGSHSALPRNPLKWVGCADLRGTAEKDQHDHASSVDELLANRARDRAKSGCRRSRVAVTEQTCRAEQLGSFVTQPRLEQQPRSPESGCAATSRRLALDREERRSNRSDTVPSRVAERTVGYGREI